MTKSYRKIFIQNPSFRIEREPLAALCDELVTVCDTPLFDELAEPTAENRRKFEHTIQRKMHYFDYDRDAIAVYGDPLILAMMISYISQDGYDFTILRFSQKRNEYIARTISEEFFDAHDHV